jgi:Ser/Thr protein kinase RdoA (MazF antagonist)
MTDLTNKELRMLQTVLPAYGLVEEVSTVEPFGNGIINTTWKVTTPEHQYILQRINHQVFKKPESIAHNIRLIADYLHTHSPEYLFVAPVFAAGGEEVIYLEEEGFFRLFPFVAGSHSKDVVESPQEACEAAREFGRFTRLLSGFDSSRLQTTIPDFHNLSLRYQQFLQALEHGNPQRIQEAAPEIKILKELASIAATYEQIRTNPEFKLRVTHHDTKISNVLFNTRGEGLCVIDLDTVMPGYFISDVGDMMRTYLSPVSEEEKDLSKIEVRPDFYRAIVQGYYQEMQEELTDTEKQYFFYAGEFMIYMQALRFLTDHLNNDAYYGARYEGHNYRRARNQIVLLQRLKEKESLLKSITA